MKVFKALIGPLLVLPIALMSCAHSNTVEKKNGLNSMVQHGKDGCHGKNGQDGKNGENGLNGGNGGNGGNSDWGRGGDGGDGGNSFTSSQLEQANGQTDEWEYKILKDICRQIIDNTISQIYGLSSITDNENVLEAACKQMLPLIYYR